MRKTSFIFLGCILTMLACQATFARTSSHPRFILIKAKLGKFNIGRYADRNYEIHPAIKKCFLRIAGVAPVKVSCEDLLNDKTVIDYLTSTNQLELARTALKKKQ